MKRRGTPKRWCCLLETILLNRALAGVYFQTENLNGDRQAMEKKKYQRSRICVILCSAMTEACVLVRLSGMLLSAGGINYNRRAVCGTSCSPTKRLQTQRPEQSEKLSIAEPKWLQHLASASPFVLKWKYTVKTLVKKTVHSRFLSHAKGFDDLEIGRK